MIRTILVDLDGTLLHNGRYDPRLEETVLRCAQQGIKVGIATQRGREEAMGVYDLVGMNGVLILENGRSVYEPTKDRLSMTGQSSKGGALALLYQSGIVEGPETTLAIGDGHNDLSLFRMSRGAAVGNATSTLKALAEYVSPYRHSAGVIDSIVRFTR